jgi:tight adherence protein B
VGVILRRRGRRRTAVEPAAADTVLRLAVLLQAGLAPAQAWRYLAEAGDDAARQVVRGLDRGADLGTAIAAVGIAWLDVAAAWRVAGTVGAPLADSLRGMASALRDASEARDEVRIALAEPAGTARLMGWLPFVAVAMGMALGFDTLRVLFTQPAGIGCLVGGVGLIVLARRWSAALVRRAQPDPGIPGMTAELTAIALTGGVSIDRAVTLVAEAGSAEPDAETRGILALSTTAGVPAAELLRAAASLARHRERTAGRMRAAALSSRLLLPLGVCTLPAFLLLGVAPMLLSVLATSRLTL